MKNFEELKISKDVTDILKTQGIKVPTPIQCAAIPYIREGRDVIAEAKTGTGKTLAFLLPVLENMDLKSKNIQTLVVTPTRELAIQIAEAAEKINKVKNFNILTLYGGREIAGQINNLNQGSDFVIGTPGRILDHLKRGTIDLTTVKTLILDEADQMLFLGFKNEIETIIGKLPKKRQTLCFSATLDSQVKKLAYRVTNNPEVIIIEDENKTLDNIEQLVIETTDRRKQDMLCQVLNRTNPFMGIIFCRTKIRVDKLEEELHHRGYSCQKLHSDVVQSKREKIIKAFKNVEFQYLIATDVAARGLDITGVTHVFNYDIPENAESYIHRIGRTGRAGEKGQTYLFIDPKDKNTLMEIEKNIHMEIPRLDLDYVQDVKSEHELPKSKYNKKIKATTKIKL